MASGPVSRVKKAIVFVAIVWGLAASFVAFEIVMLRGADILFSFPDLIGDLALSSATRDSKSCDVQPPELAGRPASALTAEDARVAAWYMGTAFGRDAEARQSTAVTPAVLAASIGRVNEIARMLGTPPPGVFMPEQKLLANTEFVSFVETDAQATAHGIAVAHSPEACFVYKLGTLWGYSTLTRMSLPGERSVFGLELRHYARLIDLPESLWRPMIDRTPRVTAAEINAQSQSLTEGVAKFLAERR
jgi:hypothetical protein